MRTILNQCQRIVRTVQYIGVAGLISVFCFLAGGLTGCSSHSDASAGLQDKPLAGFQADLLQIAFDMASAIPVYPHIKDRSKMQFAVASACLQLDQPRRAIDDIEQISNWQRGEGYADYAFYSVEHGFTNDVQNYLNRAETISLTADQDWRRDRIKVSIAQTHLLLGQASKASGFSAGTESSESGKVARVEALLCGDSEEAYQAQMQAFAGLFAAGDFEMTKNSLYAYVTLFKRFYSNPARRDQIEGRIKESWEPMPLFIRIELLMEMAEASLHHSDQTRALLFVNEARAILDGATWTAQYHIPQAAKLAALRFRSGDQNTARNELREEIRLFDQHGASIVDIYKAETLIPAAEAYVVMRDVPAALEVYKRALEAAIENPNSRPQAEDLTTLCLSMAVHAVAPDEALQNSIKERRAALGDPW